MLALDDEKPPRKIIFREAFFLGKHEVTWGQFAHFGASAGDPTESGLGYAPANRGFPFDKKCNWKETVWQADDSEPVVNGGLNDCVKFNEWLQGKVSKKSPEGFRKVRLSREAEWEYATRGGTRTIFGNGNDPELLAKIGHLADGTARKQFPDWRWSISARDGYAFTSPVGKFASNGFGLHDTTGNVWEWCEDRYGNEYYKNNQELVDPKGLSAGVKPVVRGGCFDSGLILQS